MYCVNTLAGCCVDDGTGFSAQQSASPEAGRLSYERPSARPPSRPLHYSTSRIFITAGGCPKPQSDLQLINPWNRTTSVFSHRLRAASAGEGTERAGALAIIATLSCLLSALWGGGGGKGVGVHQKETGTMRAKEGIRPCILWAWRRGGGGEFIIITVIMVYRAAVLNQVHVAHCEAKAALGGEMKFWSHSEETVWFTLLCFMKRYYRQRCHADGWEGWGLGERGGGSFPGAIFHVGHYVDAISRERYFLPPLRRSWPEGE